MIEISPARDDDAAEIQGLLVQLGYELSLAQVQEILGQLGTTAADHVLLARDGRDALGVIALHRATMLHAHRPVMRVMSLVVRDSARGRGIGKVLMARAEALARETGCSSVELTSGLRRADAHEFYRALGYDGTSMRFSRKLD
jgi:GNAT superfamily N-acetyltransferase